MIERKTRKARRTDKLKRVWTERRNVILWRILSVCSPQGENERKGSVAGQFSQCPAEREKANSTFFSAVKRQLLLHARYCRQNDVLGRVRTQCIRNRVDLHIAQDDKDPHPIARFEFSSVTTEIRVTGVRGENLSLMRRPFF